MNKNATDRFHFVYDELPGRLEHLLLLIIQNWHGLEFIGDVFWRVVLLRGLIAIAGTVSKYSITQRVPHFAFVRPRVCL